MSGMTTMDIVLAIWVVVATIVAAIVARKPMLTMIRVPGLTDRKDKSFGGYVFLVKEESSSSIVLGRGDHADAIQAAIVDDGVVVKWDEGNMTDVAQVTEDRFWIRRQGS